MEVKNTLSWDHRFLYVDEKPFLPIIYEGNDDLIPPGFNSVLICLPSQIDQDLEWSKEIKKGEEIKAQGMKILWKFDFGIGVEFDFEDELTFYSLQIAIDTFTKKIVPLFKENTLGVCLYSGLMDISPHFLWTDTQLENFEHWKKEKKRKEQYLFCTEVLIHYLRLFSHRIPDDLPLFVELDGRDTPLARTALITSPERWEHFFIALNHPLASMGWNTKSYQTGWIGKREAPQKETIVNLAVSLPSDETYKVLSMQNLLDQLIDAQIPFRMISESLIREMWDDLDFIIIPKAPIQEIPKRMLEGFCAAGGTVIFEEGSLGLSLR